MWKTFFDWEWFNIFLGMTLILSVTLGMWYGVWYKKTRKWESTGIESSIIGIFSLIISFTFLMSGNAHRERHSYIHEEADAAKMLYRYSKQMPDSFRLQTKIFLIAFLDNQMNYDKKVQNSETLLLARAVQLIDVYWGYINECKKQHPDVMNQDYLEKIFNSFDNMRVSFSRHAYSYSERTPALVMLLLTISALLVGVLVGFMSGIKPVIHYMVPVIYLVIITLTMMVIKDLDNPFEGFIRPNYYDLESIYAYIKSN